MTFFDEILKQMKKLEGTHSVPVTVQLDDGGYLDRMCPNVACARGFKVLFADDAKFGDDGWCTYCGHKAGTSEFATEAQREHALATVREHASGRYHEAMTEAARRTNSKPRSRNAVMTESVDVPHRRPATLVAPAAWEIMRVEATCDRCGCRFAALGACFFCPACGHRSSDLTFEQTLRRLRVCMSKEGDLEIAIGKDATADIIGKLTEDGIGTLVTSFESFAKDAFRQLAPGVNAPKNVFQRLTDGSDLWGQNGGRVFDQIISPTELADLRRYFQQRHVIGHNSGIVDQAYLTKTGDTHYAVGQRLAISAKDVLRMAELVEKLVAGMREDLP